MWLCNFFVFNVLFTHQMVSYDPRLEFFIFYIVVFITSWTYKGKKTQTKTNTLTIFRLPYWSLIMFIYFLHIGKNCSCTWINRNCEQSCFYPKQLLPPNLRILLSLVRSNHFLISPSNKSKSSDTSHLSFKAWILKQFKSFHHVFLK